jgi:hypothetical protein
MEGEVAGMKTPKTPKKPKTRGVVEGPGYRFITRKLTKEEEYQFYRKTGNGPVAMTVSK